VVDRVGRVGPIGRGRGGHRRKAIARGAALSCPSAITAAATRMQGACRQATPVPLAPALGQDLRPLSPRLPMASARAAQRR